VRERCKLLSRYVQSSAEFLITLLFAPTAPWYATTHVGLHAHTRTCGYRVVCIGDSQHACGLRIGYASFAFLEVMIQPTRVGALKAPVPGWHLLQESKWMTLTDGVQFVTFFAALRRAAFLRRLSLNTTDFLPAQTRRGTRDFNSPSGEKKRRQQRKWTDMQACMRRPMRRDKTTCRTVYTGMNNTNSLSTTNAHFLSSTRCLQREKY